MFQKRKIFNLWLEGTQVGNPLGGAPPNAPGAPSGAPGCPRDLEKMLKFPKNI